MSEVEKVEEESLIFRENTIGTKSVEAVLRLVGMKYLQDVLGKLKRASLPPGTVLNCLLSAICEVLIDFSCDRMRSLNRSHDVIRCVNIIL